MISSVVFDVDGVLVHAGRFGAELAREYGVPRQALDAFWRGPFARCTLGHADLKRELEPVLREWGYPGTAEECSKAWLAADSELNEVALVEVERLRRKGIRCHVASTQERYRAAYLEGPMRFVERFDALFFSCRMGMKKPQPELFAQITKELRVEPGRLLLIDDQQVNVDAARAAGWNAEAYTLGEDLGALLAGHGL